MSDELNIRVFTVHVGGRRSHRGHIATRDTHSRVPHPNRPPDEKLKFDEVVEQHGVTVLVEAKALMHVVGTRVDFVTDRLRSEFVFENPNAKGACGCGESFNT